MPLRVFLRDLLEGLLKVDTKALRTLRALAHPGELTREFLLGRRARYLRPLTVFLVGAGLLLAAQGTVPVPPGGSFHVSLPNFPEVERRLQRAHDEHPERSDELRAAVYSPKGQLIDVVMLALALIVVARRAGLMASEELVFSLHVSAVGAAFLALCVWLRVPGLVGQLSYLVYGGVAFARVHQLPRWASLWRWLLISTLALLGKILALVLLIVIIFLA